MKNIHIYNTIEHKFSGMRSISQHITPVNWDICVKLAGKPHGGLPTETEKENQIQDITVSYQKIKWWFQTYIEDVFVASNGDVAAIEFFFGADYDNVFIGTPYEPTDSILCETLFKKISVLAGENLQIIEVSLRSSDFESTFHFSDDTGYSIPMDNSAFDGTTLFAEPWWCRNDCDTWEAMKSDDVDDKLLRDAIETSTELKEVCEVIRESAFGKQYSTQEDEGETDEEKFTSIIAMEDLWMPKKA
jgi:hypothetical protein